MATDYLSSQPNFVNPDYATNDQKAMQRAYADALMKRAAGKVERPTGAIGSMIDQLTSNIYRNATMRQEQGQNARDTSNMAGYIAALQNGGAGGGQPPNRPAPMASAPMGGSAAEGMAPTARSEVMPSSRVWGDKEAEAAGLYEPSTKVASLGPAGGGVAPAPVGAQGSSPALPVAGGPAAAPTFDQRFAQSYPNAKGMAEMLLSPQIAPEQKALMQGLLPRQDQDLTGRRTLTGPLTPERLQGSAPGVIQGRIVPESAGPGGVTTQSQQPAPGYGGAPFAGGGASLDRLNPLINKANDIQLQGAGVTAHSDVIKQDIAQSNEAPNVLKGVGVIKDNLLKYGDKITTGPSSQWSLEMKRAAANYAPGLMKDQLNAIAAADSINKISIGLAGTLAGQLQGGANADTFAKSLQGVPGLTTSKEGALAMADMIQQAALKQQQLGKLLRDPANFKNYPELKANFFRDNPIINPLTGNSIEMDVEAVKKKGDGTAGPAGNGPAVGTIFNGHRFKGGNPNDKGSWETIR